MTYFNQTECLGLPDSLLFWQWQIKYFELWIWHPLNWNDDGSWGAVQIYIRCFFRKVGLVFDHWFCLFGCMDDDYLIVLLPKHDSPRLWPVPEDHMLLPQLWTYLSHPQASGLILKRTDIFLWLNHADLQYSKDKIRRIEHNLRTWNSSESDGLICFQKPEHMMLL